MGGCHSSWWMTAGVEGLHARRCVGRAGLSLVPVGGKEGVGDGIVVCLASGIACIEDAPRCHVAIVSLRPKIHHDDKNVFESPLVVSEPVQENDVPLGAVYLYPTIFAQRSQ